MFRVVISSTLLLVSSSCGIVINYIIQIYLYHILFGLKKQSIKDYTQTSLSNLISGIGRFFIFLIEFIGIKELSFGIPHQRN